jgi:hypothetical protein
LPAANTAAAVAFEDRKSQDSAACDRPRAAAALPPDLADVLLQLAAAESQAEALIRDLDDERINWRPGAGVWSIAECVDHLSATSRVYLAAMREAAAAARRRGSRRRGPIAPGPPSRWFIRTLEPPPRQRLRAPAKIRPAPAARGREAVGGEFALQQAQVRDLLHEVADLDLNRARFLNPFVPLLHFSLGTGFLVIATHQRRHLWQAGRVRQHPSFP